MQETHVQSLGWEEPLEKGMATHSNILAWRIPWTEEPGGLQSMQLQRVKHNWVTNMLTLVTLFNLIPTLKTLVPNMITLWNTEGLELREMNFLQGGHNSTHTKS